jgi:RTX calcium-binding nonapeptide repeat (4 copies)
MENRKHPQRRRTILGAGAAVASLTATLALAPSASASATTIARFDRVHHVLTVVTDAGGGTTLVGRDAAGVIDVNGGAVAIQGPRATVANVDRIVVLGGAGSDRIAINEQNGPLPSASLHGGAGDDELFGGSRRDHLFGDGGRDTLIGDGGADVLQGGAGRDQVNWEPGDGSDTVDGQAGRDTLEFDGSAAPESFDLSANGSRARLVRDVGNVTMDLNGIERVDITAVVGQDTVTVDDLSGTDITKADVDLAGAPGGPTGDNSADSVVVNATQGADTATVTGDQQHGVTVSGLHAAVKVFEADGPSDVLTFNALGGNDTVDATGLAAGVIGLTVNGGPGTDVLSGGPGTVLNQ